MYTDKITYTDLLEAKTWLYKQGIDLSSIQAVEEHAQKEAEFDFNLTPEALITEWASSNVDHEVDIAQRENYFINQCLDICPNEGSPEA